jgi:hypothetical protein
MEQSPWEANSHSVNQEIPYLLWYPKVRTSSANGPYPEPDESNSHIPTLFHKDPY